MPNRYPRQVVNLGGFPGGLNKADDESVVGQSSSPEALNVQFERDGTVKRRGGIDLAMNISGAAHLTNVYAFEDDGNSIDIVSIDEDGVIYVNAGTALPTVRDVANTDDGVRSRIAHAAANDWQYLTHLDTNNDPAFYFPSSGGGISAETVSTFDGTSGTFPLAGFLLYAHSRMFAAYVHDGSDYLPHRVHFSNAADVTTWDANDWIDISPGDGEEITGMSEAVDHIVIFKERSMHALVGDDATDFGVEVISRQVGTRASDSIARYKDSLIFFDPLTGVWSYNGQLNKLSDQIDDHLLNTFRKEPWESKGFVWGDRYYLTIIGEINDHPTTTFVLDLKSGTWEQHDIGFEDACIDYHPSTGDPSIFAVGGNLGQNKVYEIFDDGADDLGSDISAHVETGWIRPDSPSTQFRLHRLDLVLEANAATDNDVKVLVYTDFLDGSFQEVMSKTVSLGGGSASYVLRQIPGPSERWQSLKVRVENVNGSDFKLTDMTILLSEVEQQRG